MGRDQQLGGFEGVITHLASTPAVQGGRSVAQTVAAANLDGRRK
jgi:hypothetical protein